MSLTLALTLAVALLATACGGSTPEHLDTASARDASGPAATTGTVGSAPADSAPTAFNGTDLDAWERGMLAEISAVKAARERERAATTPAERGAATQASWEDATIPAGAAAAGMSEQRYRALRTTLHETLQTLDFQGRIAGPLEIDTSRVDAAMKAKLARDPMDALDPASAAALRARLDRTVARWAEYMTLVAVAG